MWKIACYVRLSREDGDCPESDSIVNQCKLLSEYVDHHFDGRNFDFYIDEYVTGTKFDREQFNRLLNDIEQGIKNCIIVKDLSRFGRNYIDAGMLLENFFPRHNVRFISVLDGLDTFTDSDKTTSLLIRIKNLMHDNNSREISRNVRASHSIMRNKGMHITHAIYGYTKDPNNKYKLAVDHNVSHVVQWIFQWYMSGMGVIRIAQKLNEMGIACCSEYRMTGNVFSQDNTKGWQPNTIRKMLCNYSYIGCVHQGMEKMRSYKDRSRVRLRIEEHVIIEDKHEAIIDRELFFTVQRIQQSKLKTRTSSCQERIYLFSGFLRCANCGASMIRCSTSIKSKEYIYYKCRRYKQTRKGCIHTNSVKHHDVYDAVLDGINDYIARCKLLKSKISDMRRIEMPYDKAKLDKKLAEAKEEIQKQNSLKYKAYEDWKTGEINKDDYLVIRDQIDIRIKALQNTVIEIEKQENFYSRVMTDAEEWLEMLMRYEGMSSLGRDALVTLVKTIKIGQDQSINIDFLNADKIEALNYI